MNNLPEYNYYLPAEVLTYIFGFVDPHTLVFSCRLVCRFWKDVVESPEVWKYQIFRQHKNKFQDDSTLWKMHLLYPWYTCYALCNNVFGKNLLTNGSGEGSLTYWRDVLSDCEGLISSVPIQMSSQGFNSVPEELINEGVTTCFMSSIGVCSIKQTIDLYAHGLSKKIMKFRPPIHVREWFAVGYDFVGICHLEVMFLNSKMESDSENGQFRYLKRIERREWHRVTHTFTDYRPDVRYITFNHGVDTYLYQACGIMYLPICQTNYGDSASKLAGAKLFVSLPNSSEITITQGIEDDDDDDDDGGGADDYCC